MDTNEKIIRFCADDGTVVLILDICIACIMTPRASAFYGDIAAAFEKSVRERCHAMARRAYDECSDRRKRFRYTPWRAVFRVSEDDGIATLYISLDGDTLRHERHIWRDDVLIKREGAGRRI